MLPSVFISGDISGGSGFKKTSVLESCGSSEVIGTLSIKVRITLSSDNVTKFGLSSLGSSSTNSLTSTKLN